jgi:MTH538 TIR-like domain (DUF1863)
VVFFNAYKIIAKYMSAKEYFVTKLSFREDQNLIKDVFVYEYDGQNLSPGENRNREWLVSKIASGLQISHMIPNPEKNERWIRGKAFTYINGLFSWGIALPENLIKRKTFISYYHLDDQVYKETFVNLFGDLIVSKSVDDDDIDSDNSDEHIKRLIHSEYLSDTTVLIVLIGRKAKCRKHIDWEISGSLDLKVGDSYAGVLALFLPSHPNFGSAKYTRDEVPKRLAENINSGYAIARDWTDDRIKVQEYIEAAFSKRSESDKIINKTIPQMDKNLCD